MIANAQIADLSPMRPTLAPSRAASPPNGVSGRRARSAPPGEELPAAEAAAVSRSRPRRWATLGRQPRRARPRTKGARGRLTRLSRRPWTGTSLFIRADATQLRGGVKASGRHAAGRSVPQAGAHGAGMCRAPPAVEASRRRRATGRGGRAASPWGTRGCWSAREGAATARLGAGASLGERGGQDPVHYPAASRASIGGPRMWTRRRKIKVARRRPEAGSRGLDEILPS